MSYVCLLIPPSPTGAALAELPPRLLAVVPRVRVEAVPNEPVLIWGDARGLPARAAAERALALVRGAGHKSARLGLAAVPVAAEVAVRHGALETTAALIEIPRGGERDFLAGFSISVLGPAPELARQLEGAGLERCGELARLDRAAVEVRFGAAGSALWRLARADDSRLLFAPVPPPLPSASLEWTDYGLRDAGQLRFVINRLAGSVCAALRERGQGARAFSLLLELADGTTVERPFHPSRVNASQRAWRRLLDTELERLTLPDAITGVRLRTDAAASTEAVQGDLLDRGFATAQAAEEALARVADDGADIVAPEHDRHPLIRRRTRWIERPPELIWARPQLQPEDTFPQLALHLRPQAEPIEVESQERRGYQVPLRYHARDGRHELVSASGPDCVSGGQWEDEPYAWEFYCCVRRDGEIVLLAREALEGRWEVAGEWR